MESVVESQYGRGIVTSISPSNTYEISLTDWTLANGRHPVLHTKYLPPSAKPRLGDDVVCTYGRGSVVSVSPLEVELTSWRLAGRSAVRCYLHGDVKVVRKRKLGEMNAWERVRLGQDMKSQAQERFSLGNYSAALELYAGAAETMRIGGHNGVSNNEVRADLVETMVTCSNNAATCCAKLGKWTEAAQFARNALVLLDALYKKRGKKIHAILNKEGKSDLKLFGIWKLKSLIVIARAETFQKNYDEALNNLRIGKAAVAEFKGKDSVPLAALAKEVIKLMQHNNNCKKALYKTEKRRAQAMFASNQSKKPNQSKQTNQSEQPNPQSKPDSVSGTDSDVQANLQPVEEKLSVEDQLPMEKHVHFSPEAEKKTASWYEEHKEALTLAGIGGLLVLSTVLVKGFRKH